jgi:putative copper export protein/mono/diheme cytochrome c family protein
VTAAAAAVRWAHLLSTFLLVGIFGLTLLAGRATHPTPRAWEARMLAWSRRAALAALGSGVLLLGLQAAHVAGRIGAALEPSAWVGVLLSTQFGAVWLFRTGVILLLAALLFLREREDSTADWATLRVEGWLFAAGAAGALAWAGHAAAVEPSGGLALAADLLHLVAAGVWLGALAPLAALLRAAATLAGADGRPHAVLVVRRFSQLALTAMLILIATGLWNTWMQVGDLPSLIGTRYGWLLLAKLALLAPILGLAAVNRRRLLPALSGEAVAVGRPAMTRLARFVSFECLLALAIVAVVAALGVTPPGRHDAPWWPLSYRLSWEATGGLPGVRMRFLIGSQIAVVGLLALAVAMVIARSRLLAGASGLLLLAIGLGTALPPLSVDAYPTTFQRTTVPYHASSISRGLEIYRSRCAACHGVAGWGDGPAGAGLPRKPADLTAAHTAQHTAGDMFWWISRGIPAAGMPGFAGTLSDDDSWDLVNFIRALSAADGARILSPAVEPNRPRVIAPDATIVLGPMPARSLKEFRGTRSVLFVFFTLPDSMRRLDVLARSYETIQALGAEIVAVPLDGGAGVLTRLGGEPPIYFTVATDGTDEIARAYGLFRRTLSPEGMTPDPPMPSHMELLIDRAGYLRARWIPGDGGPGWASLPALVAELQQLNRETPAPPPPEHVH